ncbi:MAG: MerR family Zn(II)-responsive transcriptional regulator of zntA [Pseudohongiellaceae bacterium]|jgi:MerR family Zn(II)-responsive transcriptional regulator of zntA
MRVSQLAEKVNVTHDTVRYYTRIEMLFPTKSLGNGYKDYSKDDEKRLVFIVKSRHLGFSVSEIKEIISMSKTGKSPCCKVREVVQKHLVEAELKIAELHQLSSYMQRALDTWQSMPDSMPDGNSVCDLIEMWEDIDIRQRT